MDFSFFGPCLAFRSRHLGGVVCSIYSRHSFAQSCLCHKLQNLNSPNNSRLRFAHVDPLMDYIVIRCFLEAVGFLPPEACGKLLLVDVAFRSAIRECQPVLDLSVCRRAKTFNQISLLVNAHSFLGGFLGMVDSAFRVPCS